MTPVPRTSAIPSLRTFSKAAADIAVDCPFHAGDTLREVGTTATVAIATHAVRWLSD
jgi:hypothetical protein